MSFVCRNLENKEVRHFESLEEALAQGVLITKYERVKYAFYKCQHDCPKGNFVVSIDYRDLIQVPPMIENFFIATFHFPELRDLLEECPFDFERLFFMDQNDVPEEGHTLTPLNVMFN